VSVRAPAKGKAVNDQAVIKASTLEPLSPSGVGTGCGQGGPASHKTLNTPTNHSQGGVHSPEPELGRINIPAEKGEDNQSAVPGTATYRARPRFLPPGHHEIT